MKKGRTKTPPASAPIQKAKALVTKLKKSGHKLVLAESCTGGALAALLTEIPSVSDIFCGSFVVYRDDSKLRWLGVRSKTLRDHTAVSEKCAREMALGALKKTPEANLVLAITGYLGPGGDEDGLVYLAVGSRRSMKITKWDLYRREKASPALRDKRRRRLLKLCLAELASQ